MVAHDLVDRRSGDQPGSVSVGLGEDDGAAKEEEGADPHYEKEIRNEAVIFPVVSSDLGETKISPSDVSEGEDADINEEEDEEKAGKYGIIEQGTLPQVQIGDFTVPEKEESGGESKNEEAKIDNQGSVTVREVNCPSEEEIESSEDTEDNDMGSADCLASQSMIQVCSDVEFLVPIVEDNVFLHPVVTGGDQGTCSLNLNLEGKREKQTGVSEVKNGLARKVFVERPQSFPEGHHAAACQAQVGAMGDSMLEPNLANRRDNMPSWAAVTGRISEKNVDGTLEQNNVGMSTRCFLAVSRVGRKDQFRKGGQRCAQSYGAAHAPAGFDALHMPNRGLNWARVGVAGSNPKAEVLSGNVYDEPIDHVPNVGQPGIEAPKPGCSLLAAGLLEALGSQAAGSFGMWSRSSCGCWQYPCFLAAGLPYGSFKCGNHLLQFEQY
ncbi:hypothetical protein U1Q18_040547 [Sarracenia purpurea var. burkii]